MKKLSITLLISCSALWASAQITTTTAPRLEEKTVSEPLGEYTGEENFLPKEKVRQYIGQELYLKGQKEHLRESGYLGFIIDYTKSGIGKNIYKNSSGVRSDYYALAEKYFEVIDVIDHPKGKESVFLKLVEKESKDTLYHEYRYTSKGYQDIFPFIVVKHFEYKKEQETGKQYRSLENSWISRKDNGVVATLQGKELQLSFDNIWTCVDLTIDDKFYEIAYILENEDKDQIVVPESSLRSVNDYGVYSFFCPIEENPEFYKEIIEARKKL